MNVLFVISTTASAYIAPPFLAVLLMNLVLDTLIKLCDESSTLM